MPASVQIADDDVHNNPGITQIPDDDVHNHPDDIRNLPGLSAVAPDVSLDNVPDFEKSATSGVTVSKGDDPDAIAHAYDENEIKVDDPSQTTQPVINHETLHLIQHKSGMLDTNYASPTGRDVYDYGGIEGLEDKLSKGKNLSDLNDEQQAEVLGDYTKQMQYFKEHTNTPDKIEEIRQQVKQGKVPKSDLDYALKWNADKAKQYDRMQKAYGPFIHQMSNMANTSKDTINTIPQAPGPPPAALTGMIKPPPEIGGKSINLPTQPAPVKTIKKPSWNAAAASSLGRRQ